MNFKYFPGCTLYTKGKAFDDSGKAAAQKLGFTLEELPEWTCCGATFPLAADNNMALLSPSRALINTKKEGGDKLVTLCAVCHNVLKRTSHVLNSDEARKKTVTAFLEEDYDNSVVVTHYLEILRDVIGFQAVSEKVQKPLAGLKIAPFYGCLLLRPAEEMKMDDPDRPTIFENLIKALGGEVVDYPMKAECCGAFQVVNSEATATRCSKEILDSAKKRGADLIVTACPLCQFNLEDRQKEIGASEQAFKELPVLYFTELLALALGGGEESIATDRHYIDPMPVLRARGLVG
ncbi:disulfide reductase [bacterium]|nr:MAG: disulfide reductase [bacterium]